MKPSRPPRDQPRETSRRVEQPSVLAQAQESEVRRRLAEMEADPALRIPFSEADAEKMFREFADARAQKTSSRHH